MIPPVVVHCGFGALLGIGSVPLALRKVPMNRFYGVRIPEAFASDERWYDINAYGGKVMVVYGAVVVAFGLVARGWTPAATSLWTLPFTVGPLVAVVIPILLVVRHARRGPAGG